MKKKKHSSIFSSEFGVCIKSKDWTVQYQNKACVETCGHKIGQICQDNCHQIANEKNIKGQVGAHTFKQKKLGSLHFDLTILETLDEVLTVLCPVEKIFSEKIFYYQSKGLTSREMEVAMLRQEGLAHKEICERLFISNATLKTHINNILSKLQVE